MADVRPLHRKPVKFVPLLITPEKPYGYRELSVAYLPVRRRCGFLVDGSPKLGPGRAAWPPVESRSLPINVKCDSRSAELPLNRFDSFALCQI